MLEFTPGSGPGRSRSGNARPAFDLQRLFERLPPHALEAEMSLLGSMILDPRVIGEIVGQVSSGEHFYNQGHAAIFDALIATYNRHQSGDLVQLTDALRDKGVLDDVGGPEYLVRLAESVPSAVNAPYYAKIVREKHQLRKLIDAAGQILYDAYHTGEADESNARDVLDRAEQRIFDIAEKSVGMDMGTLAELLQETMDILLANEGRSITGLSTGFHDLDEITSGLQPGELVIVAARPSMGKTAFALNLAQGIAERGLLHGEHGQQAPVGIFSMEMSRQALVQRLLCAHARVDSHRFRTNRLSRDEFRTLAQSCDVLSRVPMFMDDTPGLSVLMLRAKARRMVAQHGVKCVIIDYLQLMTAPGKDRESRQVEVSAISRGVKALARELNIPVICLAQLNRGAEMREGHRPRMADLRESGSIEQDADVIMLLHREEYYHQADPNWALDNPDKVGVAEIIVAKQRNGPTGTVELGWDAKSTRFLNRTHGAFAPEPYAPPPPAGSAPARAPARSITPVAPIVAPAPATSLPVAPLAPPARPAGPVPFSPGSRSGPVGDFRDGGGPDRDEWDEEPDSGPEADPDPEPDSGDSDDEPAPF